MILKNGAYKITINKRKENEQKKEIKRRRKKKGNIPSFVRSGRGRRGELPAVLNEVAGVRGGREGREGGRESGVVAESGDVERPTRRVREIGSRGRGHGEQQVGVTALCLQPSSTLWWWRQGAIHSIRIRISNNLNKIK